MRWFIRKPNASRAYVIPLAPPRAGPVRIFGASRASRSGEKILTAASRQQDDPRAARASQSPALPYRVFTSPAAAATTLSTVMPSSVYTVSKGALAP